MAIVALTHNKQFLCDVSGLVHKVVLLPASVWEVTALYDHLGPAAHASHSGEGQIRSKIHLHETINTSAMTLQNS